MHVVVAGSHGFLGGALVRYLRAHGHRVTRLVRRPVVSPAEISWDPDAGRLDPADLAGVDAVVNLGGVTLGRPWTPAYRRRILASRTGPTGLLARTLADAEPRVLVQASAVGYYGDRDTEVLTEESGPGEGFLADVVRAWEDATRPAEDAGVRVVRLRSGIVMAPHGGAFGRLLPLLCLGLGGTLGDGRNTWSWITLVDHVRAVEHLLTADVAGPVNVSAPEPATQREVIAAVARRLHRPAVLRVPRWALRAVLGGFADDVCSSQVALPRLLLGSGFAFAHPTLDDAAAWLTRRGPARAGARPR